jgi:hypothetical protein
VSGAAVEFHQHTEFPVLVVEVASAPTSPTQRLTIGARQTMPKLHAPDVSPFQYRMGAISDVVKGVSQFQAPP